MAKTVISIALTAPPLAVAPSTADDRERAQAVVKSEHGFVWRTIRRMGVPSDSVDDATQQVFMVLFRRMHEIKPGQERSFLFGTVVRVASEFRRKPFRRREVESVDLEESLPDPAPDPEKMLQMRRDRELLDALLDELPTEQRTAFVLYEFEELTLAAISDLLGIPQGTVASRLRKARERIEHAASAILNEANLGPSKEGR